MIYYELKKWLIDKGREQEVCTIIDSNIFSDINLSEQIANAVEELRQLGENIIADKLERGEISFSHLA